MGIGKEVASAYDIVIGRIVWEKQKAITNHVSKEGYNYDFHTSYAYGLEVDFSYKGQLKNTVEILGGKGRGDCGASFQNGKSFEYHRTPPQRTLHNRRGLPAPELSLIASLEIAHCLKCRPVGFLPAARKIRRGSY